MKKTIFKTITVLMLSIFISSCEYNDDNILDITDEKLESLSQENNNDALEKANNNPRYWKITSYEGGHTWLQGHDIPHVGTYINAEAERDGFWSTTGGFEIVGDYNRRTVRVLRTSKEAGTITFGTAVTGGIYFSTRNFIEVPQTPPPPSPCPGTTHLTMRERSNRVYANNYDQNYTYEWTVVNRNRVYNNLGSSVGLFPGSSEVTLKVSMDGCTIQTKTQFFFIDSCRTC